MLEVGSDSIHVTERSQALWTEKVWLHAGAELLRLKGSARGRADLDCEQSLFCSEIRGEERKTPERAGVTSSVTCE